MRLDKKNVRLLEETG